MKKTNHSHIKNIFLFATIFLIALSILTYVRINNLIDASDLVNHTQKVKLELEKTLAILNETESSQRGYMITLDSVFLNGISAINTKISLHLSMIDSLTQDNPTQQQNLIGLKAAINKRLNHLNRLVALSQTSKISTESRLQGKVLMEEVRTQINKMESEEEQLLNKRLSVFNKETFITPLVTIFLIIGSIVILIAANLKITNDLKISDTLKENLKLRTTELELANESLQQKNQEIALSKYNKRFLTEFSEKFSDYKVHNAFFNSLVTYIFDITLLDYVFVGKLYQNNNNEEFIETIAITAFGEIVDNIIYPMPDGPCEQVIIGKIYSYPQQCQLAFPKNGTIKQFNVEGYVGYPLFDGLGNAIGIIAVMHQKPIEDAETIASVLKIVAKRAEMEMERIKNENAMAENNKALEINNQELAHVNKELESFTYISSHDLQEPLRKIQTFSTRIIAEEHQNLSEKGKEYFVRMQDAALRMQTLIADLLAYSRTKTAERKFENTDLNKIVEEVKLDLKEEIQAKHALIEANELCEVNIIPFQFRQLLHNLIGNALKFSIPDQAPHIKIRSSIIKLSHEKEINLPIEKDYCHIIISDNGIGFEQKYSKRIFEVFQRLHGKTEYEGTGIGLTIVKSIVDNHNGIITATSELNKGATFDIYIPA